MKSGATLEQSCTGARLNWDIVHHISSDFFYTIYVSLSITQNSKILVSTQSNVQFPPNPTWHSGFYQWEFSVSYFSSLEAYRPVSALPFWTPQLLDRWPRDWVFPSMGVPRKHLFLWIFPSKKSSSYWGSPMTPWLWKPSYGQFVPWNTVWVTAK